VCSLRKKGDASVRSEEDEDCNSVADEKGLSRPTVGRDNPSAELLAITSTGGESSSGGDGIGEDATDDRDTGKVGTGEEGIGQEGTCGNGTCGDDALKFCLLGENTAEKSIGVAGPEFSK
jgi:hypothetical protein